MVERRFLAILSTWVPKKVLKGLDFTIVLLVFFFALLSAVGNLKGGIFTW